MWDEALAVLLDADHGGVMLRIVDVSSEIFWVQFLLSTLGSPFWNMVFVVFPRIVKLLLSLLSSLFPEFEFRITAVTLFLSICLLLL